MKPLTSVVNSGDLPFTPVPVSIAPLPVRQFATVQQCAEIRPFTEAALRDLKFKAFDRKNSRDEIIKGNGTGPAGVWVQIGSKVLIDLDRFDAWIASHRVVAEHTSGQRGVLQS